MKTQYMSKANQFQLALNSSMTFWSLPKCWWKSPDCELVLASCQIRNANFSCSDYAEQVWIWESEGGTEFFFDVGEVVRFRVESEEWHDQIPNAPDVADETPQERRPPYSILVGLSILILLAFTDHLLGLDANGWNWTHHLVVGCCRHTAIWCPIRLSSCSPIMARSQRRYNFF